MKLKVIIDPLLSKLSEKKKKKQGAGSIIFNKEAKKLFKI